MSLTLTLDGSSSTLSIPSLNPRCLEVWLYLKISQVPFVLEESSYPYFTLTGELPCIKWGRDPINAKSCISYLKQEFCDLDDSCSLEMCADFDTYRTWLFESVDYAQKFLECSHVAVDTYAQDAPLPINFILREQHRRTVAQDALSRGISSLEEALRTLRSCYVTLNHKLGRFKYFSKSDRPSSLDVSVAARIASHFHSSTSLTDAKSVITLKQILELDFPALVGHFHRVLSVGGLSPTSVAELDAASLEEERKADPSPLKTPAPKTQPYGTALKTFTRTPTEAELIRRKRFSHGVAVVSAVFVFVSIVHSSLRKEDS
jgi:hypothetical protein